MRTCFGVRIAEIVKSRGVARVQLDRLAHLRSAQVLLLVLIVERAEGEVEFIVTRLELNHLLSDFYGVGVVLLFLVYTDQKSHDLAIVGLSLLRILQVNQSIIVIGALVIEV